MTFILGLSSIIQAVFLPGFLVTGFLYPIKGVCRFVVVVGLSLLINYQFVFITVLFEAYNRLSVFLFFGLECLVLIWLLRTKIRTPVPPRAAANDLQWTGVTVKDAWRRDFKLVFYSLAGIVAIVYVGKTISQNPGIFNSGDDVVSWNRWAIEWYNGKYPQRTYHYPQLIPANWSMMYHFIGTTDLQFFAKSIMILFAWGVLFMLFDLFRKTRSDFFLAATAFAGFLIIRVAGNYVGSGYMDVPLAFCCTSIFYLLLLTVSGHMPGKQGLLLAGIFLAISILVKQGGIFMIFPFIASGIIILNKSAKIKRRKSALLIYVLALVFLLAAPWYIYKENRIRQGIEDSEVAYVTNDIFQGKAKIKRLQDGTVLLFSSITNSSGVPGKIINLLLVIVIAGLTILSVFTLPGRYIMLLLLAPYYCIWGVYFSYDLRNAILILPFWGLSMGIGAVVLANLLPVRHRKPLPRIGFNLARVVKRLSSKINRYWTPAIFSVLAVALITCSFLFSRGRLLHIEKRMAMEQLMDGELNRLLYQHFDSVKKKEKVLSDYLMMPYLPGLAQFVEPFGYSDQTLSQLKSKLEDDDANYRICVLHDNASASVWDYFNDLQADGKIFFDIRTSAGWHFIKVSTKNHKQ